MSKFYLPSSTPASTTTPSPLVSPSPSTPTALPLRGLPSSNPYPTQRNTHSSSALTFSSSDDEDDDLPYPLPLPRAPFLAPSFTPETYLATQRSRHQTLEDLRSELRERVKLLNAEMLELVNGEYEDLMSVGLGLRDGRERVEGVRVGVLGFEREIEGLAEAVRRRKEEMKGLLGERTALRMDIGLGRRLVDVHERLGQVEGRLGLGSVEEEEDDEEEDGTERLGETVRLWAQLAMASKGYEGHPFVLSLRPRMEAVRTALLLDLGAALRVARRMDGQDETVLRIVGMYKEIDEGAEVVKVLKSR